MTNYILSSDDYTPVTGQLLEVADGAKGTVKSVNLSTLTGPASSTDNALVRWNGANGKSIQNSTAILSDTGGLLVNGNITCTSTLAITNQSIFVVNGNLNLGTAGNKINIATGTNASVGITAAMTAGTITVNTTAVTANSIILLTHRTLGGTPGILTYTISTGVHFVITSTSSSDTSTVGWLIIN